MRRGVFIVGLIFLIYKSLIFDVIILNLGNDLSFIFLLNWWLDEF